MRKLIALLMLLPLFMGCGFEIVDNGHRGYQTEWSQVLNEKGSLQPGWHWFNPWGGDIVEVDVRTQLFEDKLHTYTKDIQQAVVAVKVNYRLQPDAVHHLVQELTPDDVVAKVLLPAIQGDLKKVIGQYEATDLIAHRQKATEQVETMLRESVKSKYVVVERLELANIDYTKEFEHAVEQKQVAIQKAVEEANRTKQKQELANQIVITATADARSIQIKANALSQNPKLIEWEQIQMMREKWDGKYPQYMLQMDGRGGSGGMLMQLPAPVAQR